MGVILANPPGENVMSRITPWRPVNSSTTSEACALSVVVASVDAARSIDQCLRQLRDALTGMDAELIVVDASKDGTHGAVVQAGGYDALIRYPAGTLTPELWAAGIGRSRGRVVALTTGHCLVPREWGRVLATRVDTKVIGAAGALDLAAGTTMVDWAVYYLRYSDFIPFVNLTRDHVRAIPADNAAYDGDAIRAYTAATPAGFWEVDFHRSALAEGKTLAFVGAATALLGRSFPLMTIVAHRFAHGRHSGSWRVKTGASSVIRSVVAAPLVPLILATRTARRVLRLEGHRARFAASLPVFLLLATSWALGEAWGAVAGSGVRSLQPVHA